MNIAAQQRPPAGSQFLDHVAHFVPSLAAARQTLEALGFVATPESAHQTPEGPAGTSNICVMLERGYLEILSPTLDTPAGRNARGFMQRYAGVHLGCFGTPDAEGEFARLRAHGFEPPPMVDLSREAEPGIRVRFKVVRSTNERMPEGR